MPAHKTNLEVDEKMLIRQRILVFLMSNGFLLIDNKRKIGDIDYDYVQIQEKVEAVQMIEDFTDGVEYMKGLKIDLDKYTKSLGRIKLRYEWNYLGQNQERETYTEYLVNTFWSNQNNTDLQGLTNYQQIVEKPWRIIHHSNLVEGFRIPADFFGETTNSFVMKISEILDGWEINPFLMFDECSNFQWSVFWDDEEIISGVIFKNAKGQIMQKYSFGLF